MGVEAVTQDLFRRLEECGYRARVTSIQHLQELQDEIVGGRRRGLLDEEFYETRLAWFVFEPPATMPQARSLLVIAVPRPQAQAVFTRDGRPWPLILPPTYAAYERTNEQIAQLAAGILAAAGYHVARTKLPLKLLAARSGLGAYGRNNICYVPGMGSFHQLVALYSDLPCPDDSWQEAQMMVACQRCTACLRHCPTGAITAERFLLHAERCIVFHNEKPGNVPFPAWLDPSWHNCLYGCMHCQSVCPEDRDYWDWIGEREEFTEEETALLLAATSWKQHAPETIGKLERLDLLDDPGALARNIGVLATGWR